MAKSVKLQFLETTSALMTAAFGLVAALAWNGAITGLINNYFPPEEGNNLVPLLIYAVIVTIIAVICIVLIARTIGNYKDKLAEEEAAKEAAKQQK